MCCVALGRVIAGIERVEIEVNSLGLVLLCDSFPTKNVSIYIQDGNAKNIKKLVKISQELNAKDPSLQFQYSDSFFHSPCDFFKKGEILAKFKIKETIVTFTTTLWINVAS